LPRFTRVIDTPNSVTYIPDFLAATEALIEKRRTGVWNIVNPGPVSLFQMMQIYREIVDPKHDCTAMSESEAAGMTRAPRSNCVLSTLKLAGAELAFPSAEIRMREVLLKRVPTNALHR
jgi:dTDP-4-dehydrorhamnose reductase